MKPLDWSLANGQSPMLCLNPSTCKLLYTYPTTVKSVNVSEPTKNATQPPIFESKSKPIIPLSTIASTQVDLASMTQMGLQGVQMQYPYSIVPMMQNLSVLPQRIPIGMQASSSLLNLETSSESNQIASENLENTTFCMAGSSSTSKKTEGDGNDSERDHPFNTLKTAAFVVLYKASNSKYKNKAHTYTQKDTDTDIMSHHAKSHENTDIDDEKGDWSHGESISYHVSRLEEGDEEEDAEKKLDAVESEAETYIEDISWFKRRRFLKQEQVLVKDGCYEGKEVGGVAAKGREEGGGGGGEERQTKYSRGRWSRK